MLVTSDRSDQQIREQDAHVELGRCGPRRRCSSSHAASGLTFASATCSAIAPAIFGAAKDVPLHDAQPELKSLVGCVPAAGYPGGSASSVSHGAACIDERRDDVLALGAAGDPRPVIREARPLPGRPYRADADHVRVGVCGRRRGTVASSSPGSRRGPRSSVFRDRTSTARTRSSAQLGGPSSTTSDRENRRQGGKREADVDHVRLPAVPQ